jgi:flotillin
MNFPGLIVIATVVIVLVVFLLMFMVLSRYTKVGPNQVLIVSGRKIQLPDGTFAGFRVVKGGGTFVWPVIERTDILSLEVTTIEMARARAQTAGGRAVEADGIAQIKISGDDASIVAAAEHFLSKSQTEIKNIVRPVLEKHLSSVLGGSSLEETTQNPAACAARVQTSAAADLGKMGLNLISFTIRNARATS